MNNDKKICGSSILEGLLERNRRLKEWLHWKATGKKKNRRGSRWLSFLIFHENGRTNYQKKFAYVFF